MLLFQRNHRPRFDGSVVVKINVNQRYATTTTSFTVLSELAKLADVKLTVSKSLGIKK